MKPELDRIDLNIIRLLQQDGRLTNVELAKRVNLSPTPCLERVRRLEKAGYILGYAARLNPGKLAAGLTVFVQVTLDRTTSNIFDLFRDAILQEPRITDCHMVAGGYDYLLKVRTRDMDSFRLFLGDRINALPGVISTATYVAMETLKDSGDIPIPSPNPIKG